MEAAGAGASVASRGGPIEVPAGRGWGVTRLCLGLPCHIQLFASALGVGSVDDGASSSSQESPTLGCEDLGVRHLKNPRASPWQRHAVAGALHAEGASLQGALSLAVDQSGLAAAAFDWAHGRSRQWLRHGYGESDQGHGFRV